MFEALYRELWKFPGVFLRFKAKLMGRQAVAWFDLGAPLDLPQSKRSFPGTKPSSMVGESFSRAYPALGNFFQAASDRQKLGRLGAATRQAARRFLHQLDAEQGIAHLHDLQRIAWATCSPSPMSQATPITAF